MKKWFRLLALALVVCMMASFAACAKAPANQNQNNTAGSNKELKGELDALLWLSSYPQVVDQFMADWKAKYPNVTVNLTMMSGNSTSENLEPRIAANNMPDVTSVDSTNWYYVNADKGFFRDVSDTNAWKNQRPVLQQQYTSTGGVKYGVAYGMASMFIYYNKTLFDKAGITDTPKNYKEFLADCEKLKAAGITPIAWPGGFPNMLGHGFISAGVANIVYRKNDKLVQDTLNTNYDYGTPEWKEVFQRNVDIVKAGYVNKGYMSTDNAETIRLFKNNEVAMVWNGSWAAGDFLPLGDNVQVFLPPWNNEGDTLIGNVAAETGFGMGNTKKDNVEAAKTFFNFVAFENYAKFQNVTGTIPTFPAEKLSGTKVDPRLQKGVDALTALPVNGQLAFQMFPDPVYTAMMQFAQDTLIGSKKVDDIGTVLNPLQKEYISSKAK